MCAAEGPADRPQSITAAPKRPRRNSADYMLEDLKKLYDAVVAEPIPSKLVDTVETLGDPAETPARKPRLNGHTR